MSIKGKLTYKGTVYPWHCDHMEHMNVMWYVGKFDEATWAFFGDHGVTASWLRAEGRGMVALEQHLTYQREVLAGDTLEIYTRVLKIGEKTVSFIHEMIDCKTGQTASTSEFVGVHLDTTTRKSAALPKEVREKLQAAIEVS